MRRYWLAWGLMLLFFATACGGSEDAARPTTQPDPGDTVPSWVAARLGQLPGPDVPLAFATSDHGIGENRLSFAVLRPDQALVKSLRASVLIVREDAETGVKVDARLVPLGAHSHPPGTRPHTHPDLTELYVTTVDLPRPGKYWLVVEPVGKRIQAYGRITVRRRTISPPIGTRAIPSQNPTTDVMRAEEITTAQPPDLALLRYSVAGTLEAREPFVVVFATPAYCQSRTCGPSVDVVEAARKKFERRGIRFIHIEVYEKNNPKLGVNRWMKEWGLPTEPWIFVVDRRGIIRAKFEGAVSEPELEAAIRRHLL